MTWGVRRSSRRRECSTLFPLHVGEVRRSRPRPTATHARGRRPGAASRRLPGGGYPGITRQNYLDCDEEIAERAVGIVKEPVESGKIPEERIDESCGRILRLKMEHLDGMP